MKRDQVARLTLVLCATSGCVSLNPSVVAPAKYLAGGEPTLARYHGASADEWVAPFDLRAVSMDGLMLFAFEGDERYREIELQVLRHGDEVVPRVILYLHRGSPEIYFPPGAPGWVAQEMSNLDRVVNESVVLESPITYTLEATPSGLHAELAMTAQGGLAVAFHVRERGGGQYPTGMLAPIGSGTLHPEFFPLFYIHALGVVRRDDTDIGVSIGGKALEPETLSRFVKGPACYLVRYSNRTAITQWNARASAELSARPAAGRTTVTEGDFEYQLVFSDGHAEIAAATATVGGSPLRFRFAPPVPELLGLAEGARGTGRFVLDAGTDPGVIAGEYSVSRQGGVTELVLHPTDAWQPPIMSGPPWVASYTWKASFTRLPTGKVELRAAWSRATR